MNFRKLTIVLTSLLLATACSTDKVQLNYNTAGIRTSGGANAVISSVSVKDSRGTEPDWLGAVRGGFGNPLKTLLTEVPVKDIVRTAFTRGLTARGLMAAPGSEKLELAVDVKKFDCSQFVRREAHAVFWISLVNHETRRTLFDKTVQIDRTSGEFGAFDVGIFGSIEDLRKVANDALQEAVDKALDDEEFHSALAR